MHCYKLKFGCYCSSSFQYSIVAVASVVVFFVALLTSLYLIELEGDVNYKQRSITTRTKAVTTTTTTGTVK